MVDNRSNNNDEEELPQAPAPKEKQNTKMTTMEHKTNEGETPLEKQLVLAIATVMKSLDVEINNLKTMYDSLKFTNFETTLDEDIHIKEAEIGDKKTEYDKYQYDLLTPDADEFPLSVVITDTAIRDTEIIFDLPARNIKDFDRQFHPDDDQGIQIMFDTDLSANAGPLDRNIFTVGSKLPDIEEGNIKPMFDSNLKGGPIPPQIGLSRRRDITIFLEDYVQHVMKDCDLLVKPPKGEPIIDPNGPKAQYDCDLGRSPAQLKSEVLAEIIDCTCCENPDDNCTCDCQDNLDNVYVEDTHKDILRGMFDYDLNGGVISRPKQEKSTIKPSVEGGPMWDYELCHKIDNSICICFERKESACCCNCNDTDSRKDVMSVLDPNDSPKRPMFDYDLCLKPVMDLSTYSGVRGMFDTDLNNNTTPEESENLVEQIDIDPEPGEGMFDYDLKGGAITKPSMPVSRLRKYAGLRGMFDFDLKFVIDPSQTVEGICCICIDSLQPNCKCGCTVDDINKDTCKCIGDSVPRAMYDRDLGKKFKSIKPPMVHQKPNDPCNCLEKEVEEDDTSEIMLRLRSYFYEPQKVSSTPNLPCLNNMNICEAKWNRESKKIEKQCNIKANTDDSANNLFIIDHLNNVLTKNKPDYESCKSRSKSTVQIQTEIALGPLLQSTSIGHVSEDESEIGGGSNVSIPWERITVTPIEKPKMIKKLKKKKKDCAQSVSLCQSLSDINSRYSMHNIKSVSLIKNLIYDEKYFKSDWSETEIIFKKINSVSTITDIITMKSQGVQSTVILCDNSTDVTDKSISQKETGTQKSCLEVDQATNTISFQSDHSSLKAKDIMTSHQNAKKSYLEINQATNTISSQTNYSSTKVENIMTSPHNVKKTSSEAYAMFDTDLSVQPKDAEPCQPGCEGCRLGKADEVIKTLTTGCELDNVKSSCSNAAKSKDASIMFTKETDSCGCDTIMSKIIQPSCASTTNTDCTAESILKIARSNILRETPTCEISQSRFPAGTSMETTMQNKINFIPSWSASETTSASSQTEPVRVNFVTSALVSYENEIRPLREALASLQQKIKSLNLPELGATSGNTFNFETETPTTTNNFNNLHSQIQTVPDRQSVSNHPYLEEQTSDFSKIVRETDSERQRIRKKKRKHADDVRNHTRNVEQRSPLAEMYVNLAKKATSNSTFYKSRSAYNMPHQSSTNLTPVRLQPDNFILGSTALRTDPDTLYPTKSIQQSNRDKRM